MGNSKAQGLEAKKTADKICRSPLSRNDGIFKKRTQLQLQFQHF